MADRLCVIIRCVCASNVCDIAANTSGFLFIDDCFQKEPTNRLHTHTHCCVASSHFSVPVNRFNRSHVASSRDCLFVPGHTSSCQQNDSDLSTVRWTSYLHSTTVLMSTSWIKLFFDSHHSYRRLFCSCLHLRQTQIKKKNAQQNSVVFVNDDAPFFMRITRR